MFEFSLHRVDDCNVEEIIFGYSLADAFRRHPELNPDEWIMYYMEYVD